MYFAELGNEAERFFQVCIRLEVPAGNEGRNAEWVSLRRAALSTLLTYDGLGCSMRVRVLSNQSIVTTLLVSSGDLNQVTKIAQAFQRLNAIARGTVLIPESREQHDLHWGNTLKLVSFVSQPSFQFQEMWLACDFQIGHELFGTQGGHLPLTLPFLYQLNLRNASVSRDVQMEALKNAYNLGRQGRSGVPALLIDMQKKKADELHVATSLFEEFISVEGKDACEEVECWLHGLFASAFGKYRFGDADFRFIESANLQMLDHGLHSSFLHDLSAGHISSCAVSRERAIKLFEIQPDSRRETEVEVLRPWRFRIREIATDSTRAQATLVVCPPSPDDRQIEFKVELDVPAQSEFDDLRWYFGGQLQTPDQARARSVEAWQQRFGSSLVDKLFADRVAFSYLHSALNSDNRILWTIQGSAAFQRVPWESMKYLPAGLAFALEHIVSRRVVEPQSLTPRLPHNDKLRVLWVTARMKGDQIPREIVLETIQASVGDGIEIECVSTGKFRDLVYKLRQNANRPQWHILHLDMHGGITTCQQLQATKRRRPDDWIVEDRAHREDLSDWSEERGILFFEDDGKNDPVDARELAQEVCKARLPLVVLNACHSAAVPYAASDASLTAHLVTHGASAALGFHQALSVVGAQLFYKGFYESLASSPTRTNFHEAVRSGRRKLQESRRRGSLSLVDWALPVLYDAGDVEIHTVAD